MDLDLNSTKYRNPENEEFACKKTHGVQPFIWESIFGG